MSVLFALKFNIMGSRGYKYSVSWLKSNLTFIYLSSKSSSNREDYAHSNSDLFYWNYIITSTSNIYVVSSKPSSWFYGCCIYDLDKISDIEDASSSKCPSFTKKSDNTGEFSSVPPCHPFILKNSGSFHWRLSSKLILHVFGLASAVHCL